MHRFILMESHLLCLKTVAPSQTLVQKMIMGPEHSGKHDRYIKRFLRTGEARILGQQRELEAMRRDGSFFPISLGVTEVSIPGNTDGSRMFAAYIHDLTQRHQVIGKSD